jgi:hypothetical protein
MLLKGSRRTSKMSQNPWHVGETTNSFHVSPQSLAIGNSKPLTTNQGLLFIEKLTKEVFLFRKYYTDHREEVYNPSHKPDTTYLPVQACLHSRYCPPTSCNLSITPPNVGSSKAVRGGQDAVTNADEVQSRAEG